MEPQKSHSVGSGSLRVWDHVGPLSGLWPALPASTRKSTSTGCVSHVSMGFQRAGRLDVFLSHYIPLQLKQCGHVGGRPDVWLCGFWGHGRLRSIAWCCHSLATSPWISHELLSLNSSTKWGQNGQQNTIERTTVSGVGLPEFESRLCNRPAV